jgi:hypothetical protein
MFEHRRNLKFERKPNAFEVRSDDPIEIGLGHQMSRPKRPFDPSVVERYIDTPKVFDRTSEQNLDILGARDVCDNRKRTAPSA